MGRGREGEKNDRDFLDMRYGFCVALSEVSGVFTSPWRSISLRSLAFSCAIPRMVSAWFLYSPFHLCISCLMACFSCLMALFSSRALFFSLMILVLLLESWLTRNSELPDCDGRDPSERSVAVSGLDRSEVSESSD